MAHGASQGMWLQVPALDVSESQAPSDRLSCYNSCLEHYRTCRHAHAGARLLGTISFYHMKRFQLYAGEGQHSSYEDWAQSFKNHPDNPELRTADMEWLARAGGIMSYVMRLEDLPDQGRRADYIIQEVGSLTQLKAVFAKVFNKRITWNAGERLEEVDLLVYEFRRIRDALKAPGTIQQLYKEKWPSKAKKASTVTGPEAAEPLFPPVMQEESAGAAQAEATQTASAAGAADMGAGPEGSAADVAAQQASGGSHTEGRSRAMSVLAAPTPAVTAPAAAPAATATTTVTLDVPAVAGHGADGHNVTLRAAAAAAAAVTASAIAVNHAAVGSDHAAGGSSCATVPAGVASAAAEGTGASGAAGTGADNSQTALSGSEDNPQEQEGRLQQLGAQQRNLRLKLKINLPASCNTSREPSAAVGVAAPEPDSPAQPHSPFQQFLHVLIQDDKDSSGEQQQQQQQEQERQARFDEGIRGSRRDQEDEHAYNQQVEEQQEQPQQSSDDDTGTEEDQTVSEDGQPRAAAAAKGSTTMCKGKRTCSELAAVAKPGPSKKPKKQQGRGSEHECKAGSKAATGDRGKALTVDCAAGGSLDGESAPSSAGVPITPGQQLEAEEQADATEASSADDDSSMTDDNSAAEPITAQQREQQQVLLHTLQQKRVLGGTLLQWMKQHTRKIGLRITAEQAEQEGGLLNQVFVVTEWSTELAPLVNSKNNRTFMVVVVPDQQVPDTDDGINSAKGTATGQMVDTLSEWKGEPAEWRLPKEMLTACRALKQRAGAEGDHIVASHAASNLQLRHNDLACLRAPAWLSDECVNFYMALLQDRDSIMYDNRHLFLPGTGAYHTYFFNTHFTSKLKLGSGNYSYKEVRRWTSPKQRATRTPAGDGGAMLQQEVLKYDRLVIPIHQQTPYQHWTVLLVDLKQQRLVFFDSYKTDNPIGPLAMARVKTWLTDEAKDKFGEDWKTSDWAEEFPTDLPRQNNDYDCGVFTLMACNRLGLKGGVFDFNQDSMSHLRAAIAHDLRAAKLTSSANPSAA